MSTPFGLARRSSLLDCVQQPFSRPTKTTTRGGLALACVDTALTLASAFIPRVALAAGIAEASKHLTAVLEYHFHGALVNWAHGGYDALQWGVLWLAHTPCQRLEAHRRRLSASKAPAKRSLDNLGV